MSSTCTLSFGKSIVYLGQQDKSVPPWESQICNTCETEKYILNICLGFGLLSMSDKNRT